MSSVKKNKTTGNYYLIWHFLKGCRGLFLCALITSAFMTLTEMIIPQMIRIAIDNCIGNNEPSLPSFIHSLIERMGGYQYLGKNLWIIALAISVVALFRAVFTYLFRLSNTWGSEIMVKSMRDELFHHIEHLPFSWHMSHKTGDIIQRCTSDIDTLRSFVEEKLSSLLRVLMLLIFSMTFMILMNPILALIAFIPIPLIVMYSVRFHKQLMPGFMECDINEGILSDKAQENLTGVRVVRAFGQEQREQEGFVKHNKFYTSLWVNMAKTMSRFWSVTDVLCGSQIMLVAIFGAILCVKGKMYPGEYIAFCSYNAILSWPIRELGRMIIDLSKTGVSLQRIKEILDADKEETPSDSLTPPIQGDIVFDHVSFSYKDGPFVLDDVSFTMKGGTTLGILGGTGSGKSTLVLLLDKLYDLPNPCGTISIGGIDIRKISSEHLRKNIGMVLQEPYLFSRSLKENISITEDSIDMDKVQSSAKAACLDSAISDFTKGYDTFVGERGVTLSGGQKQRTAIARTLLAHPPIMIFDDSLSAVDTETDEKIRTALEKEFGTASIILISHRITTLNKADQVIVLDKGKIAEIGTPEELKTSGGIYQKIYEIQTGDMKEDIHESPDSKKEEDYEK